MVFGIFFCFACFSAKLLFFMNVVGRSWFYTFLYYLRRYSMRVFVRVHRHLTTLVLKMWFWEGHGNVKTVTHFLFPNEMEKKSREREEGGRACGDIMTKLKKLFSLYFSILFRLFFWCLDYRDVARVFLPHLILCVACVCVYHLQFRIGAVDVWTTTIAPTSPRLLLIGSG